MLSALQGNINFYRLLKGNGIAAEIIMSVSHEKKSCNINFEKFGLFTSETSNHYITEFDPSDHQMK